MPSSPDTILRDESFPQLGQSAAWIEDNIRNILIIESKMDLDFIA